MHARMRHYVRAQVPLFEGCESAFIAQLVMRLKLGVFLPGEDIFHIGDVGHEMYFITKVRRAVRSTSSSRRAGPLCPAPEAHGLRSVTSYVCSLVCVAWRRAWWGRGAAALCDARGCALLPLLNYHLTVQKRQRCNACDEG